LKTSACASATSAPAAASSRSSPKHACTGGDATAAAVAGLPRLLVETTTSSGAKPAPPGLPPAGVAGPGVVEAALT
jgi:hypothetical protein